MPRLAYVFSLACAGSVLVAAPRASAGGLVDTLIEASTPHLAGAFFHYRIATVPWAYEENGKLRFVRTPVVGARITEFTDGPLGTCSAIAWNTLCGADVYSDGSMRAWGDLKPFTQTTLLYGQADDGTFSARLESVFVGSAKLKEIRDAPKGVGYAFGTIVGIDPTIKGGPISVVWHVFTRVALSAFPFAALRLDLPMSYLVWLPVWLSRLPYLLGIPRIGVEVVLPLGPVFVGARYSVPTRFIVVPWFFDGAETIFEVGLQI